MFKGILGAIIGAIAGAVAGASVGGPIGAIVGAIVGGILGWGFANGYSNQSNGISSGCSSKTITIISNPPGSIEFKWFQKASATNYKVYYRKKLFLGGWFATYRLVGEYYNPTTSTTISNLNILDRYIIKVTYEENFIQTCLGQIEI